MDIAILSGNAIRIKGKKATIVIDSVKETNKTEADCILKLKDVPNFTDSKIENSRITITGPGEYEIGGIKVSVLDFESKRIARLDVDLVKVLVGNGEVMGKVREKFEDSDVLVVDTSEKFNYSSLTSLDPKIVLGHGANAGELEKALGKSNSEKSHKISLTAAKLPSEMQFIHLA